MKRHFLILITIFLALPLAAQENEEPKPEELAAKELERLSDQLDLEDWQIFYVDSTLNHDYECIFKEMEVLRRQLVENRDLYLAVQDKWMEKIEKQYQKIFTPEQWTAYLKNGGAKIIADREKRRAKAAGVKYKKEKTSK